MYGPLRSRSALHDFHGEVPGPGYTRPVTPALRIRLMFIFILGMVAVGPAAAQDLYTGEVVVGGQSAAERDEAVPGALIQVLQKLSGQRELPASPVIDRALARANELLLAFRYKKEARLQPDGNSADELHLVASFRPGEVDRVLRQAGMPRWQADRPVVQVWAVIDDGQTRTLKPLEYQYAWQAMQDIASRRGLQLSWPELDNEEMQLLDMRLVWGGFTDYLAQFGAPSDGVLIVTARREGPQWLLRWNLAASGRHWSWHNSDRELMFALAAGVHRTVDAIAAVNSIAAQDQGQWQIDLSVENLRNGEDYNRCLAYLQSQVLVTSVQVVAAEPGRAHFRLQINAAPRYLVEAFQRAAVLLPIGAVENFQYRFLR